MALSDILAKLFDSANRVKFIRLFLLNPDEVLTIGDICRRTKASKQAGRKETAILKSIGFIKSGSRYVEVKTRNKKGKLRRSYPKRRRSESRPRRASGKKIRGWKLNESFPLIFSFKNFILDTAPVSRDQLLKKLQRAGRMKLVVLSGVFVEGGGNRIDILIVGDGVKRGVLEKIIKNIETEMSKELTYVVFNTNEFIYRMGVYDKLIRDIFDFPHEKLLDKIGI